ncbi:MAG: hypothetical protein WC916_05025 [Candidatus Woesearchaeota archaeon]
MASINWCFKTANGIRIINPSEAYALAYLRMADESIRALSDIKESLVWKAAASYYIFYYSLYAVMMRIGVKCEIHACSIAFMKRYLMNYYSSEDARIIETAFTVREDTQYYVDRPINTVQIDAIAVYCLQFCAKTRRILTALTNQEISSLRKTLMESREE